MVLYNCWDSLNFLSMPVAIVSVNANKARRRRRRRRVLRISFIGSQPTVCVCVSTVVVCCGISPRKRRCWEGHDTAGEGGREQEARSCMQQQQRSS